MRVLIVHPCKGFYGGAEEVVAQLREYLVASGHSSTLVTKEAPDDLLKRPDIFLAKSWYHMRNLVRCLLPYHDVVNAHNFPATLTTFPTRKPIVYMCNEPAEIFTSLRRKPIEAFNRWWIRKSKMKVVVADQSNADRFKKIYEVSPTITHYGVDYEFWSGGTRRNRSDGGFMILQVGHPELFPLGRGIYEEISKTLPQVELVQLFGKSHEEVRDCYNKANVLLHPIGDQGGWLVPFEALCTGLPVIVSRKFTGASVVQDNDLGIVTDDYVGALRDIWCFTERHRAAWTEESKRWIRDNLSWEKFGEAMVRVFEEAMSENFGAQ